MLNSTESTRLLRSIWYVFSLITGAVIAHQPPQLTMYNGGSIPGRLLPNYLADKYGNLNVICACLVACACIIFGMLGIKGDNVATVCVIAVLYGFFSGAVIALMSPLGPSISNGPHEIGMRLGVLFLFVGPAGLLSGPIAGWLLGNTYRWDRAIYFSAVRSIARQRRVSPAHKLVLSRSHAC